MHVAYTNHLPFNKDLTQKYHRKMSLDDARRAKLTSAFYKNLLPKNAEGFHEWGEDGVPGFELDYFLQARTQDLCNGKLVRPPDLDAKVRCHLLDRGDVFTRLGPFKVEMKHHRPEVVVIHDFISKKECQIIRDRAKGRMSSTPFTFTEKDKARTEAYSSFRTSKVMYMSELKGRQDHLINKVSDRISSVTGFDIYSQRFASENYQVMNYGIGGFIKGHADTIGHFKNNSEENIIGGLRMVTFMTYLSDVSAGGRTVFPQIGVSVKPEAGKAVFWFNIHSNGEFDSRTFHLGCPVIHGNKWIANKWVKWSAQMLKNYPCKEGLKDHHYSILD